ncbi:MAG: DUF2975 domain-containing protein [Bacilli bacterium]|nr:DUF2975 domain-containing protein [Bacilli bacterium]
MNNILELCKIFHCHINELVNDSIIDVDSFDEDVRENVVKLKKEQQRKMKGLSKAISVIAKIMSTLVLVVIPVVIATMIFLGVFATKVDIKENEITFNNKDKIVLLYEQDKIKMQVNEKDTYEIEDQFYVLKMKDMLNNNSKYAILGYLETGFLCLLIFIILIRIMLKSLSKLFDNINKGDTPFTLENVNHIKKIAYLMIVVTLLPGIIGVIFEIVLNADLNVGFELFSLIEVLFLFSIAYIFQYGYEIQLDSKGIMYGDIDE